MAVTGTIRPTVEALLVKSLDLTTPQDRLSALTAASWSITTGTAASQADELWHDTRTLTASANDDLNLSTLTNAFGDAIALARVKCILVYSRSDNDTNILVGAAAANPLATLFSDTSDQIIVRPDGAFLAFAPDAIAYAVTTASADILRVAHDGGSSNDVMYDIVVIGASA